MVVLRVRAGLIPASEAARLLGVSRNTYYRWEGRALRAMLEALEDRRPGRPRTARPDPDPEGLRRRIRELEAALALAGEVSRLREMIAPLRRPPGTAPPGAGKKKP